MDDHAGRVQHRPQVRRPVEQLRGAGEQKLGCARLAGVARFGERRPERRERGRAAVLGGEILRSAEQGVDGGQLRRGWPPGPGASWE